MTNIENKIFSAYQRDSALYDEIFDEDGTIKQVYQKLFNLYGEHTIEDYVKLNSKAKSSFFNQGITFQVYGDKETKEKIFPFDLFPRIIDPEEWEVIEKGSIQRSKALNLFGIYIMIRILSVMVLYQWI